MSEEAPCCVARRHAGRFLQPPSFTTAVSTAATQRTHQLVSLAGGEFLMGTDDPYGHPDDAEGPVRPVTISPFRISATAVTNAQFAEFVTATAYRTDAERFGSSFVFAGLLPPGFPPTRAVEAAPWWRLVEGARWDHPEGPQSSVTDPGLPVVHVSWNDAMAYCAWAKVRLPTEAEWEYAARGGLEQKRFPWGDELHPGGRHRMNVWHGDFPYRNTLADGYLATCPVNAFPPNDYGLYNMTGNVWEWCADPFHPSAHTQATDPRAMRGGSYLCHESYCRRYRVAARSSNTPDSSAGNLGFRCAASPAAAAGREMTIALSEVAAPRHLPPLESVWRPEPSPVVMCRNGEGTGSR